MGRGRLYVAGSRSIVGEYRLGCEVERSNSGSRVSRITSHLGRWRGCRCFNIYSETTVKPKKLRGSTTVSGDSSPYCTEYCTFDRTYSASKVQCPALYSVAYSPVAQHVALGGNRPSDSVALPVIAGRLTSADQCITPPAWSSLHC